MLRSPVCQAASALLHEGLPSKGPAAKYVLRTDVAYRMPRPEGRQVGGASSGADLLDPQVGEALFDLSSEPSEREGQLVQLQRLLSKPQGSQGALPRGGPFEAAIATLRNEGIDTSEWEV